MFLAPCMMQDAIDVDGGRADQLFRDFKHLLAIELFDERIVAPAIEATAGTDAVIVVTCDHFTPVARRTHTEDPVPFLIHATRDARTGGPSTFDEASAAGTGLFLSSGRELMALVLGARP